MQGGVGVGLGPHVGVGAVFEEDMGALHVPARRGIHERGVALGRGALDVGAWVWVWVWVIYIYRCI